MRRCSVCRGEPCSILLDAEGEGPARVPVIGEREALAVADAMADVANTARARHDWRPLGAKDLPESVRGAQDARGLTRRDVVDASQRAEMRRGKRRRHRHIVNVDEVARLFTVLIHLW